MERATTDHVAGLVTEVGDWPGVETAPHRFAGTEFRLGDREFGHVHRGGLLDVNFTRRLRDLLVAEGRTGPHHVVPDSGWTSFAVREPDDVARARWLLRLSYLYTALLRRRTPEGAAVLAAIDPVAELDELGSSRAVRAAFDRLLD
jgi:hypothetical protein